MLQFFFIHSILTFCHLFQECRTSNQWLLQFGVVFKNQAVSMNSWAHSRQNWMKYYSMESVSTDIKSRYRFIAVYVIRQQGHFWKVTKNILFTFLQEKFIFAIIKYEQIVVFFVLAGRHCKILYFLSKVYLLK